jgi:[Skp1-protein]-hydroxyproline N-acetylglucosaminyltransferase
MSSIFVQIASYDDEELPKTIQDCLNKSSKHNKIYFGIHECYIDNKTIFEYDNIKIQYSKAPENLGVGMGRYLANNLYDGEDYYLQIDSHSRFRENWDVVLIDNLNKHLDIDNKCILTGYPPGYWYEEDGSETLDINAKTTSIKLKRQKDDCDLFKEKRIINQEGIESDETFCSESISAGFIFGTGEISKVKQHPGIFYLGEEILRAAAFYTNGYNLMIPEIPVIFHLYGNDSKRVPCWVTYPNETNELEERSRYLVKALLSEYDTNPTYGVWLGTERDLEMYGRYVRADFKYGIIY